MHCRTRGTRLVSRPLEAQTPSHRLITKGNTTLLDWINDEIKALGEENFFHADYEATLVDTYGSDYEDELVVEGGVVEQ